MAEGAGHPVREPRLSEKPQFDPDRWKAISHLLDVALELPDAERRAWLDRFDPRDAASRDVIEELLEAYSRAEAAGFLASPVTLDGVPLPGAFAAFRQGIEIGPYRLVREIGRGGMGTVWLAERGDGRFERRVAVKFLSIALTGRIGQERFKREGRILGGLLHPHIAELLDAGVTETGHPYLVLEHVDGKPIDAYCRERSLDAHACVRLFLDVLAAVAHAHANLIVHRDIKPSNVLVTTDGRVKLLDFGIAKLMEQDGRADATLTGESAALTPLYAAPEQLQGEAVTTATDVYALGVLLYMLLAGRHPAGDGPHSPADLMRAVVETEPPRPSEATGIPDRRRRQLRGDLDTIVARALKKNPAERYASVTALGEDLSRYLKREPIRARPDTLLYRASKFVGRNRLAVAGVTLASVALIVTAGVAVRQGIDARDRFDQVRKMAHTFLFDFHDELDRVAGTTKAKELLVSTAREYLDNLARSAGNDRDLLRELAEAYERLAEVQGGSSSANLNQRNAALESRMRAIEIRKRLAGDDQRQDAKLVKLLSRVTDDLRNLGRLDDALLSGRRAVGAGEQFLRGAPPEILVDLGSAHVMLGRVLLDRGQLTEAEAEFKTGEELLAAGAAGKLTREMVAARLDRADTLHALGRLTEAVRMLEQNERDAERLVAESEPGSPLMRALRSRQVTWATLAIVYDNPLAPSLDQPERALLYRDKLRSGWEHLISVDPGNDSARADLATCDSETAVSLLKIDPPAAVVMAARGLARLEALERTRPDDGNLVFRRARGATRLALALLADGRPAEALPAVRSSQSKHRELFAEEDSLRHRLSLVWTLTVTGRVEKALRHDAAARLALEEATRLAEPLAKNVELPSLRVSAEAYQAYGDLMTGEERCRSLRRAQEIWDSWTQGSSPWVEARRMEATQLVATCLNP
jgi:serine/threonine protein kinase/tetratricopeptide (TPR) repeat protein